MANVNSPFGLRPVRHANGAPWNGQTVKAFIDSSYATALYIGDPVDITATTADRDTTGKYLSVKIATAGDGNVVRGVIVSFDVTPTNLSIQYGPASTTRYANIVLATPDIVFQIQDDGTSSKNSKNFAGGANGVLVSGSGSTRTGLSGWTLDSSAIAADQSNQLYILGVADIEGNDLADYAIWDVIINTCYNATGLILGVTGA